MYVLLLLAAPLLELEVGVGRASPASSSEPYPPDGYPAALQLRAGAALRPRSHLSVGLEVSAVLGGEGLDHPTCCGYVEAGFETRNALATMRLHSLAGRSSEGLDVFAQVGAGLGQVVSMQTSEDIEHAWLRGQVGPAIALMLGGGCLIKPWLDAGLQVSWQIWTRVGQEAYDPGTSAAFSPARTGIVVTAVAVAAVIGFASPL